MQIELSLHSQEALYLLFYLEKKLEQIIDLRGAAADSDFVLAEWLLAKYRAIADRIGRKYSRKPTKLKMPISVARILWKYWQQEFIPPALQLVLNGIDQQLKNKNLTPIQL